MDLFKHNQEMRKFSDHHRNASKYKFKKRPCNLCGKPFKQHSRYERFCSLCRNENEVYRFS